MIGTIIGLVLMGLVVGALARLLVPGRDSMSIGATILLGIVGTIVGGLVGRAVFHDDAPGFFTGLVTAVVLLLVLRRTTRRSHI
ncbi:MAG TPA: GlsB/YeaQ/YmgE family stress response membrane protein [Mycobacteriales bacterium]|nr:GlsB/YeaQ/YmgE family stress response membrane protein [Mycobacteriales bacterium]